MDTLAELIELYEYKVADVVAGRNPRGGKGSLNRLRLELLGLDLEPHLLRRLMQADRQYRRWIKAQQETGATQPAVQEAGEGGVLLSLQLPVLSQSPASSPSQPSLSQSPQQDWLSTDAQAAAAWQVVGHLQRLAWFKDTVWQLQRETRDLRYEPQRPTLRVLYAVTENTERLQRGVTTRFPVPTADDPLVSLGNKDVVSDLTIQLARLLLTQENRQLLMTTLAEVRDNPFPVDPSEETLRELLVAAGKEPLTPHAREQLIAALHAQYPKAPDPRERPALREAATRLQRLLEEHLKTLPGEGGPRRVLFAPLPGALLEPDQHATELLIYLGAEQQETVWRGVPLRWQAAGPNWQLQLGQQVMMLYPHLDDVERHIELPGFDLYFEGAYLLLKVRDEANTALGLLAAQARAVALLLRPSQAYANLRLARATAQVLRGAALNLPALTPESALQFSEAAPDVLQDFARQGLNTLGARLSQIPPREARKALSLCAAALNLPESRVERLHETLHNALYTPDHLLPLALPALPGGIRMLRPGGHFQTFTMENEPLNIGVRDRVVTLRWDYKNDLTVATPGLPSLRLKDLLVVPLSDMDLVLVRQGQQVAVASLLYQPEPEEV